MAKAGLSAGHHYHHDIQCRNWQSWNFSVGFGAVKAAPVLGELGNFFQSWFMNRHDIIEFQALSKDNLLQIVNLVLDDVNQRLTTNDIHLDVQKVKEKLVDLGYDPNGGRPAPYHSGPYRRCYYWLLSGKSEKAKELKAIMTSNGKIIKFSQENRKRRVR